MKKISLFLLLTIFTIGLSAQTSTKKVIKKINWMTLEEAQELTKKDPKPIVVDMYTHWCGPCRMMMSQTFTDGKLIDYMNENFYAVKFNAEGPDDVTFNGKTYSNPQFDANKNPRSRNATHEFVFTTGLRGYPTLMIYNPDLEIAGRLVGFQKAPQVMRILKKYVK